FKFDFLEASIAQSINNTLIGANTMTINKFYRVPILAACLLLIVTGVVFKTIKVKAAGSQCFPDCNTFYQYQYNMCPGGSSLSYSYCGESGGSGGWNVMCQKSPQSGGTAGTCLSEPECFTAVFACPNPPYIRTSQQCKAQFTS